MDIVFDRRRDKASVDAISPTLPFRDRMTGGDVPIAGRKHLGADIQDMVHGGEPRLLVAAEPSRPRVSSARRSAFIRA
jgi:hypothetical protein